MWSLTVDYVTQSGGLRRPSPIRWLFVCSYVDKHMLYVSVSVNPPFVIYCLQVFLIFLELRLLLFKASHLVPVCRPPHPSWGQGGFVKWAVLSSMVGSDTAIVLRFFLFVCLFLTQQLFCGCTAIFYVCGSSGTQTQDLLKQHSNRNLPMLYQLSYPGFRERERARDL